MRLWDLRTNICQGILHTPGSPVASFDQQGLVFGVGTEAGMLKLYDVRSYDKGPFDTFVVSRASGGEGQPSRRGRWVRGMQICCVAVPGPGAPLMPRDPSRYVVQVPEEANSAQSFADIKFSNDGKYILAVVEARVFVLDAFDGSIKRRFVNGSIAEGSAAMEASISADNRCVPLQGMRVRPGEGEAWEPGVLFPSLSASYSGPPDR